MKGRILAAAVMVTVAATTARAQVTGCPAASADQAQNAVRDACIVGGDVFQLLGPQLGLAIAGGNATLGQGGTLGGFPHFVVSVRGNIFAGDIPDFGDASYTPRTDGSATPRTLKTDGQIVGMPVIDAAIGVFKGIPLGLTNVGGVDLLVSAAYVPRIGGDGDDFQIDPENPLQLGFGARVGLLQESLLSPGVAVTFIRRDLPTTDIFGRSSALDLNIRETSIKTTSWRVVANKNLLMFGLAAGVGQDRYSLGADLSGVVHGAGLLGSDVPFGTFGLRHKMTRTNMFADLSMNLPFIKFVGEIGRASGGDVTGVFNSFSGAEVDEARVYGSFGVRIGL